MIKQAVKETSIDELIKVIENLPSSKSRNGWLGWLDGYDGPGFYNRKPGMKHNAGYMYMHNASPTGLLWLVQVLGVNQELVKLAETDYKQAKRVSKDKHTLSAVIRKRVSWKVVDRAIADRLLALDKAYQRKLLRSKMNCERRIL